MKVSTNGKTVDITKDNGSAIRCMERALISGKTVENMKEGTTRTRSMGKVDITGQMGKYLKVNGCMGKDKEREDSPIKLER